MPHLGAIFIYPVKSLGGIALQEARVTPRGLKHDRRFMVVHHPTHRFLTQRELPQMATLQTTLHLGCLHIQQGRKGLTIPLLPEGDILKVQVWRDEVEAIAVGELADIWLSEALGTPCRLVWMPDDCERRVDENYARGGEITSFADGFPVLLVGENSLADLNDRLENPLPFNRFRANFHIAGAAPWEEDGWKRFRIGGVEWENLKPCARCIITTIDQQTGATDGPEPLRTLATFRRSAGGVMVGANLVARTLGRVSVGDVVEVLERF